ncbi:MAG: UbiD family decarboxylase, partial [Thermodesulfobacteriota bacterium]|nr:UbiD family decarboxylase [Thermodesulfobacteriota bacterium]
MSERDISSLRSALKFINEQDELLIIKNEVDPIYEISGISKVLDGSLGILFENIKGFPEARCVCNLLGTRERMAIIFDIPSHKETKFQALRAIRNPIPPKIVDSGPCQENVITENIDVLKTIPIIKHTEEDAGRI